MNTPRWITQFEENARLSRDLKLPDDPCTLPDAIRIPLAKSLAVFQLGESGGGTRLRRYAKKTAPMESFRGYQRALDLFIAEEQGHSDLLGQVVDHLGGARLVRQWSNSVFRSLRVLVNLEFNIQVLLTAELIAEVYYGTLHLRCTDPVVRFMARKILRDEMMHLRFQRDFLSERVGSFSARGRRLWEAQFRMIHKITSWVVAWDHRACLRAIGSSPAEFRRASAGSMERFMRRFERSLEGKDQTPAPGAVSRLESLAGPGMR